jgi:hypothetical protein
LAITVATTNSNQTLTPLTAVARVAQIAAGGYALGQHVLKDGVTWKSIIDNNTSVPGESGTWSLFC